MMLLPEQTTSGIHITGNFLIQLYMTHCYSYIYVVSAFIELLQFVFTLPGVTGFLSNKIVSKRDRLEKFFGIQRIQ